MMRYFNGQYGGEMLFMMMLGFLLFFLLVVGVIFFFWWFASNQTKSKEPVGEPPLSILKARYAKGEISKEEYESMKKDLA